MVEDQGIWWSLFFSNIMPCTMCQGYFQVAHVHMGGVCLIGSSQRGAYLLQDVFGAFLISLAIITGFVSMSLLLPFAQSRGVLMNEFFFVDYFGCLV